MLSPASGERPPLAGGTNLADLWLWLRLAFFGSPALQAVAGGGVCIRRCSSRLERAAVMIAGGGRALVPLLLLAKRHSHRRQACAGVCKFIAPVAQAVPTSAAGPASQPVEPSNRPGRQR